MVSAATAHIPRRTAEARKPEISRVLTLEAKRQPPLRHAGLRPMSDELMPRKPGCATEHATDWRQSLKPAKALCHVRYAARLAVLSLFERTKNGSGSAPNRVSSRLCQGHKLRKQIPPHGVGIWLVLPSMQAWPQSFCGDWTMPMFRHFLPCSAAESLLRRLEFTIRYACRSVKCLALDERGRS